MLPSFKIFVRQIHLEAGTVLGYEFSHLIDAVIYLVSTKFKVRLQSNFSVTDVGCGSYKGAFQNTKRHVSSSGVMVSMVAFQAADPVSITGWSKIFFFFFSLRRSHELFRITKNSP